MLMIARRLSLLNFGQLMEVYAESVAENGAEEYPNLPVTQQILTAQQDFYQYLNEIFFRQENSFYALWQVQGRYGAALRIEPYCDGYLLCALETAPVLRRKGHAVSLINSVVAYLKSQNSGVIYAHVSKENIPSLRTHQNCGFSVIADFARYADGSILQNSYTLCLKYSKSESN